MRFLHLADLHLGKVVNGFSMIEDQGHALEEIYKYVRSLKLDAVLVAGDVYDAHDPSEEAVALFSQFLTRLSALGTRAFIVGGEHDSEERLGFASSLLSAGGAKIVGKFSGKLEKVELSDSYGKLNLWLMPYMRARAVAGFYKGSLVRDAEEAVRLVLDMADVDFSERNVIVAHQFVSDGGVELGGSEDFAPGNAVPVEVFAGFDYVALGHVHRAQGVGGEYVRYAGSPIKYSLSEMDDKKSLTVVDVREKGRVELNRIKLKPFREMKLFTGRLSDVCVGEEEDCYAEVLLTDRVPAPDAFARLRARFPHLMRVSYETGSDGGKGSDFESLIRRFYGARYAGEPSEREMEMLASAAREVGILEEVE